jgi:MoaA/NifB/PqqE/SkfB family radical SAM enzyme
MSDFENNNSLPRKRFSRVYIEISNVCNLQCDFCPEVERSKKVMSYELFKTVIDQVKDLTDEVTFHLMGEPLAHPRFLDFLQYCEEQGVPVNLTTNGTLLHLKNRKNELFSSALRQVNFSLQSYLSNFPSEPVMPYLRPIFDYTRRALEMRPDLYINYRLWNVQSDQSSDEIFNAIQNEFSFQSVAPVVTSGRHKETKAFRKSQNVTGRLYLHFDSRFKWPSLADAVSSEKGFCYGLRSQLAIHADGTVVPCCLDKEARISLGQVQPLQLDSVVKAIQSPRAQNILSGFEAFEAREALCQRCTFIRRFDSKIRRGGSSAKTSTTKNAKLNMESV